jgi:putative transposase
MARPTRNANPSQIHDSERTFFATTRTSMSRRLFQSERNANLLIHVLRSCVAAKEFKLHDFVIMPDHVHLLISVNEQTSIERALQLIKGRFSYRVKKEEGFLGQVWQKGFSEVRVYDQGAYERFRRYIENNPVKAGLVKEPLQYPHSFRYLAAMKAAAKAGKTNEASDGTTEVMP